MISPEDKKAIRKLGKPAPSFLTMDSLRRIPGIDEDELHSQQMYVCSCCNKMSRHIFDCRGVRRVLYVEIEPCE